MTALIIILAAVALYVAWLAFSAIRLVAQTTRTTNIRARADHDLHMDQMVRFVEAAAAERREWAEERHRLTVWVADEQARYARERSELLNRIQDPVVGVTQSLTLAAPEGWEPGAMDLRADD